MKINKFSKKIIVSILTLLFALAMSMAAVNMLTAKADVTLDAISSFKMSDKQQLRIIEEPDSTNGVRFIASLSATDKATIDGAGYSSVEYGFFIMPSSYITSYGALNEENCFGDTPVYVWDDAVAGDGQYKILHGLNKPVEAEGGNYELYASVVDFYAKNLATKYVAQFYIKTTTEAGVVAYKFATPMTTYSSALDVASRAVASGDEGMDVVANTYLTQYTTYCTENSVTPVTATVTVNFVDSTTKTQVGSQTMAETPLGMELNASSVSFLTCPTGYLFDATANADFSAKVYADTTVTAYVYDAVATFALAAPYAGQYQTGKTIEVPAATFGELTSTVSVTAPSTSSVSLNDNQLTLDESGAYTVTYTANGVTGVSKTVQIYSVDTVSYLSSSDNSATWGKNGTYAQVSNWNKDTTLYINEVKDVSNFAIAKSNFIIQLRFQNDGSTLAYETLNVKVTDYKDANNYFIVQIFSNPEVRAAIIGRVIYSDGTMTTGVNGVCTMFNNDTLKDNAINILFDYASAKIALGGAENSIQLDTERWNGFTDGKCLVSMTADDWNVDSTSIHFDWIFDGRGYTVALDDLYISSGEPELGTLVGTSLSIPAGGYFTFENIDYNCGCVQCLALEIGITLGTYVGNFSITATDVADSSKWVKVTWTVATDSSFVVNVTDSTNATFTSASHSSTESNIGNNQIGLCFMTNAGGNSSYNGGNVGVGYILRGDGGGQHLPFAGAIEMSATVNFTVEVDATFSGTVTWLQDSNNTANWPAQYK